ncbi:2906_t:CDS:2 [Diversispora eburnea]|uniref:Calreticulin n=1 Tax=Diversispora eburnea TaxID=1213867 RepID=A0A9N9EYQ0_9GLOM|nr:2906_t:CDS:2 [Diversispora eburnea]
MKKSTIILATSLLALSSLVSADIYLKETFSDADWEKRWIYPEKSDNLGKFKVSAGVFYADEIESRVIQFSVKHEQNIDCGGGYIKLMPPTFDALKFNGDSIYNIMFGPDICGPTKQRVHVILHNKYHKGKDKNKQIKKTIVAPADQLTHLYTLILKPDQTYEVLIDNKVEASGKLEEDFDLFPPKEIEDPNAKKPEDWVDLVEIPDPNDTKPLDWVDGPSTIPDPSAKRSEDWDDEMDGDWEPPQIPNPDFKGEWKQKTIPNPDYKGKWTPPLIPNPEYKSEPLIHAYKSAYIGFDLWQVKSGSIFDNILITDDVESAKAFAEETFVKFHPDSKNDLPPIVEQDKDKIKVRDEEETLSDSASSSVSEETPSPSASSQTKQGKDEFDKLFEDLEAEIEEPPKRDEL